MPGLLVDMLKIIRATCSLSFQNLTPSQNCPRRNRSGTDQWDVLSHSGFLWLVLLLLEPIWIHAAKLPAKVGTQSVQHTHTRAPDTSTYISAWVLLCVRVHCSHVCLCVCVCVFVARVKECEFMCTLRRQVKTSVFCLSTTLLTDGQKKPQIGFK